MIRAKKSLGQNFLADERVSRRIVESVSPRQSDLILEIGPGLGALTSLLVHGAGFVRAVEIDSRLAQELRRSIPHKHFEVAEADAIEVDWRRFIAESVTCWREATGNTKDPRVRVVANLPYYISTAIVEKLLRVGHLVFDLTLMLQKEVVERIASGPGNKNYGYLSVLAQYHAVPTVLFDVPPHSFSPAPRVDSAVIRLTIRERPAIETADEAGFFALVRAAFAQRRKTILNNLKAASGALALKRDAAETLRAAGIDGRRRAETLSLEEFASLQRSVRFDNE